jgi:hypothetical protein
VRPSLLTAMKSWSRGHNRSAWTKERCTTRPFDESAFRKEGKWKKVRGKKFSSRHALQAKRRGAALNFLLGRASKVKVLAGRCSVISP